MKGGGEESVIDGSGMIEVNVIIDDGCIDDNNDDQDEKSSVSSITVEVVMLIGVEESKEKVKNELSDPVVGLSEKSGVTMVVEFSEITLDDMSSEKVDVKGN